MNRNVKLANLALIAALALGAAAVVAQEAASGAAPKAVAVEPTKDLGVVSQGSKVTHEFVIKNEGNAPLVLHDVRPGCGCTVAEYDEKIAPGGSGTVKAVMDTSDFAGAIAKGLTVFTNDPQAPTLELVMKAEVRTHIVAHPGYARYIYVQGAEPGTISQTMWTVDKGVDLEILGVSSPYPYLKVGFREAKQEERRPEAQGRQWIVTTTLTEEAPVGALTDYVIISTNHPQQTVARLPVSGFVRPQLAATPSVVNLGERKVDKPMQLSVHVRNFAEQEISLTDVASTLQGVTAEIKPIQEGREYQVQVTLGPELPKGALDGRIEVQTSSAQFPVLEIPIKGTVL
jgi:hypothetical protein